MQAPTATRRALLGAGAGLAAASSLSWTGTVFAHDVPSTDTANYPRLPLAQKFVSIGALQSVNTADQLTKILDRPGSHAAAMDVLFCPDLVAGSGDADMERLSAAALKHSVWLAVYSGPASQPLILTGNHAQDAKPVALQMGVFPSSLGNFAFDGGTAHPGAEIILGSKPSMGRQTDGAYVITGTAIYGPSGDVLATDSGPSELLVGARIPIAAFRKMRQGQWLGRNGRFRHQPDLAFR